MGPILSGLNVLGAFIWSNEFQPNDPVNMP